LAEQSVRVRVETESQGEEAYDVHAAGMHKVNSAARANIASFREARQEIFQYRMGIMAASMAMANMSMVMELAGVKNESLKKVLMGVNAVLAVANTMLTIKAILEMNAARAVWARVAAEVAANLWLAPVVAAIISAALIIIHSQKDKSMHMAYGGSGIVSKPTLFLAGEAGPEAYRFTPLAGAPIGASGTAINEVNIYISTSDPDAAGRAVTENIRRLKEIGL